MFMENFLQIDYSIGCAIRDVIGGCITDNLCNRKKIQAYGENKRYREAQVPAIREIPETAGLRKAFFVQPCNCSTIEHPRSIVEQFVQYSP